MGVGDKTAWKTFVSQERREIGETNVQEIIRSISHEIENNLQIIKLETYLLLQDRAKILYRAIDKIDQSLRDLGDYFLLAEPVLSEQRVDEILEEFVQKLKEELHHDKIKLRLVYRKPLPSIRIDARQFRKALERVMEFCQVLLEDGGEVEIEVRLRDTNGGKKLELTITSSSTALLGIEEKEFFQPHFRINNHYVGLGMALANRILRHHQGSIVFRKVGPGRANVIMLMEVAVEPAAPVAKKRIA